MRNDGSVPLELVEFRCRQCGALTAFSRVRFVQAFAQCLHCWTDFREDAVAQASPHLGPQESSLTTAIARARLHWYAGYISEGSSVFDDAQAVALSRDTTAIVLHEHGGLICRFKQSDELDEEGCVVFHEVPHQPQTAYHPPPPSTARVASNEIFDYSVRIPPKGQAARCARRSEASHLVHLVGASPHLRLESVGMLRGGGVLSRLCRHIIRPAVLGTRVTLTAADGDNAHVSAASFDLDEGLVNVLREDDELNLTRTRRGGLALSVLRDGRLLVALGAVSAVPLGPDLEVVVRRDRLSKDPPPAGGTNAAFPWLHPLEITSGHPPRRPKGFTIRVWYRAWPPPEDADECVTILRTGACPETAAFASTHLLAMDDALRLAPARPAEP